MSDRFDFTERARGQVHKTVLGPSFAEDGARDIFDALEKELTALRFGDYLRRYIHRKAELDGDAQDTVDEDYLSIIVDSFREHHTPASFEPTTAKLKALARNWLSQRTVKRKVVFLLGFGLAMSVEDVNEFLEKGLKERGIYPKDPFEAICWYCYQNHYGYARYEQLWEQYAELEAVGDYVPNLIDNRTVSVRNLLYTVSGEDELLEYLKWLKSSHVNGQSVTAREWFDRLFAESKRLTANYLNESELVEEIRTSGRKKGQFLLPEDINAGDIEKVIYSAVPIDAHGNLVPEKESLLSEQFGGKRFSRQRISEILNGNTEINRFDLITLYFFVLAKKTEDDFGDIEERARYFMKSVNRILEDCQMWPLYMANPYESFVYLCMQTEDPLDTYAQVLEYAYQK